MRALIPVDLCDICPHYRDPEDSLRYCKKTGRYLTDRPRNVPDWCPYHYKAMFAFYKETREVKL